MFFKFYLSGRNWMLTLAIVVTGALAIIANFANTNH